MADMGSCCQKDMPGPHTLAACRQDKEDIHDYEMMCEILIFTMYHWLCITLYWEHKYILSKYQNQLL